MCLVLCFGRIARRAWHPGPPNGPEEWSKGKGATEAAAEGLLVPITSIYPSSRTGRTGRYFWPMAKRQPTFPDSASTPRPRPAPGRRSRAPTPARGRPLAQSALRSPPPRTSQHRPRGVVECASDFVIGRIARRAWHPGPPNGSEEWRAGKGALEKAAGTFSFRSYLSIYLSGRLDGEVFSAHDEEATHLPRPLPRPLGRTPCRGVDRAHPRPRGAARSRTRHVPRRPCSIPVS